MKKKIISNHPSSYLHPSLEVASCLPSLAIASLVFASLVIASLVFASLVIASLVVASCPLVIASLAATSWVVASLVFASLAATSLEVVACLPSLVITLVDNPLHHTLVVVVVVAAFIVKMVIESFMVIEPLVELPFVVLGIDLERLLALVQLL